MAYAQWVVITIINSSTKEVVVKNICLPWGKFHKDNDKDTEVPIEEIENTKVPSSKEFRIKSCGRKHAPSGTEGEFNIYENGGEKVHHFYWECPWGTKTNTWKITKRNAKWKVDSSGANLNSRALGNITVDLYKKA